MNRANRTLATVAAALRAAVPAVLSDFELALIDGISARRAELGDEVARISPTEISLLIELVSEMQKHMQDRVAARKAAFAAALGRGQLATHFAVTAGLPGADLSRATVATASALAREAAR